MRRLTIEFPAPGESGHCDVIDEYGRHCNGLCWDEMLGQVAMLTMPANRLGKGFRMQTPAEWDAEWAARAAARMTRQQTEAIVAAGFREVGSAD